MNKQVVYIRKENGTKTPRQIAEELDRYGKLEGLVVKDGYFFKYYSYENTAIEITCLDKNGSVGEAISVRKIPFEALDTLIPSRYISKVKREAYNYQIGGF